jgi:hypothetical protein
MTPPTTEEKIVAYGLLIVTIVSTLLAILCV